MKIDLNDLECRARAMSNTADLVSGQRNHAVLVIALIARIRELEAGWRQVLALVDAKWQPTIRALLEKGAVLP